MEFQKYLESNKAAGKSRTTKEMIRQHTSQDREMPCGVQEPSPSNKSPVTSMSLTQRYDKLKSKQIEMKQKYNKNDKVQFYQQNYN